MYQIKAYIKFLSKASNQHGVHSPFVYNFVTKCLYNKTKFDAYKKLKQYKKELLQSNTVLQITDLGEGSKVLDANQRNVGKMAKTSSSSKKDSELLYRLSDYFKFKTVLELGTSLGMGTYALSLANPTSKIITIEGCPNTSNFAQSQLKNHHIGNVEFLIGNFSNTILTLQNNNFDFIFFDGHHNKEATIQYFEALLPKIHNETVFVFDDIYWSEGMTEAWEYIKNHNAVTVTVDVFLLGVVFFRKEQAKEHFKIRL
ncbi:methyltransferase family protein [Winogradskyella eximia]|uniref:Methyltransferase family protein n=1 Tax=Winogradskyella eximia TaxID=262006 RepID=A0A3D9GPQ8_9FLAO|nr:class I SAM-dependent methyltransferase [Winogradskyella eximia]RED38189.1 methyltransferase family protein [Winogradskyella eximia]